jgi:hypothetical protein
MYEDTGQNGEGTVLSDAAEWLRTRWSSFLALEGRIVDMMHEAAVIGADATTRGDTETADAARAFIRVMNELNQLHGRIVARFQSVAQYIGLGAIALPVAVATVFSSIALAVLWFFRKMDLQERMLDELKAGRLTEEGYLQANAELGDVPGPLAQVGNLGKLVLIGFLGFLAVQAWGATRRNPPLTILRPNPPEDRLSGRAHSLAYRHDEDGLDYIHDFGPGVEIYLEESGDVTLSHPDHRLWSDF